MRLRLVRESPPGTASPDRPGPKAVGERSEGVVLYALARAGVQVLIAPFSDNQRYDLVVERDGRFIRVQVKTGRVRDGVIRFAASSSQTHRGRGRRSYRGEADLFAVHVPELDRIYWVPVNACGPLEGVLRLTPPRNGQRRGIRWAADFERLP